MVWIKILFKLKGCIMYEWVAFYATFYEKVLRKVLRNKKEA